MPWLWRYRIQPHLVRKNIWSQLSNGSDRKITYALLIDLYREVQADKISRRDRKRLKIGDDAFIYGEIDFLSFAFILDKVKPQAGEIFYDLGSGAGKAVIAAALSFDFVKSVGVELLPGLCAVANEQISKAHTLVKSQNKTLSDTYLARLSRIEIINVDLQQCDFSEANIVFINATCFGYGMWEKVQEKLNSLQSGSRIIVTTKKIQHENFQLLNSDQELMSWGMNSVQIYQKIFA